VPLRIADEASLTDVGRQRHTNEDSFYAEAPVFAVADGMGGAQAGEVASAMAVEEFSNGHDGSKSPETQLADVARAANRRIWEMSQNDQQRAGMGTTLTAVMVGETDVSVGHVGDSRLYLLRDGSLERLTRDHSLVEEFVRQGRLTPEQAERHPQRSVITRALGPESDVEVDTFTVPARDGDIYVLCSDGLSGMVRDGEMAAIIGSGRPLEQVARELVDAANENGGRDNITVILFRLEDDGGAAAVVQAGVGVLEPGPVAFAAGDAAHGAEAIKGVVGEELRVEGLVPHRIRDDDVVRGDSAVSGAEFGVDHGVAALQLDVHVVDDRVHLGDGVALGLELLAGEL